MEGMKLRPSWVMCGVEVPPQPGIHRGRVRLLASKDLSEAELCVRYENQELWIERSVASVMAGRRYQLTALMADLVMIEADDWPSAFEGLWSEWAPPVTGEIEGTKRIEGV